MTHSYTAEKIQEKIIGAQMHELHSKYETSCCSWKKLILWIWKLIHLTSQCGSEKW